MQEKYKFELSGQQPQVGIHLELHDIRKKKDADSRDANANNLLGSGFTKVEQNKVYCVTSVCHTCASRLTVAVNASSEGIRSLQKAFLEGLNFYCPSCAPLTRHG
ncbi:E7 [Tick-associated papillomavirus lsx]|nr:E7 [Tick-associated papillomavirus lsx]